MLLGIGSAVRRHVTSEQRLLRCVTLRSFHASSRANEASALPFVEQYSFRPSKSPNPAAKDIAVLGGGITGLTTAYELARTIPEAKITIYEKSSRLGGWLNSEVIPVDDGEVLFEWGARSFRPGLTGSGWATTLLLARLAETASDAGEVHTNSLFGARKDDPIARNRFLFYPDHLVRMPNVGNFFTTLFELFRSVLSEPIWKGVVSGCVREVMQPPRSLQVRDESLGDFLSRRYGPKLADNIASAVMHGIYAGDIYKMSARTILPTAWYLETREPDAAGVGLGLLHLLARSKQIRSYEDNKFEVLTTPPPAHLPNTMGLVSGRLRSWSVATWSDGMAHLPRALCKTLESSPNVSVELESEVSSLTYDSQQKNLAVGDRNFDYVVSTLPPRAMASIVNNIVFQPIDKSVTVMVVNLYYRPPTTIPYEGFGYLIPRSVPAEQNPERALGVIFAHHSSGQRGKAAIDRRPLSAWLGDPKSWRKIATESAAATKHLQSLKEKSNDEQSFEAIERDELWFKNTEERHLKMLAAHEAGEGEDPEKIIETRVGQDTVEGLKFTVMLGGHWWSGWEDADYPSAEQAIDMAKSVLRRHLKIKDEPAVAKARLQRDCIPQYPVGYRDYMAAIHRDMMKDFKGRLKIAGPWYQGAVGVNDCVRRGMQTAIDIREGWDENTGAEHYTTDEKWLLFDKDTQQLMVDPMNV